ncbi:MAG: peptidyl-prolyl cis-trans isomerase, partial [Planctomycetes bacterium]|nr:peptidyl-prolyl cis-trans isomerase [Planctomycetota bacterium]
MRIWRILGAVAGDRRVKAGAILLVGAAVYWFLLRLPRPPEPDIVATYRGGKVTKEELRRYLHEFFPRCSKHAQCRRHGEDHEDCGTDEACETFPDCSAGEHAEIQQPLLYRGATTALIVDRLIAKRVAEKKLAERNQTKHLMKHVGEQLSLTDLDQALHTTKIRVEATEVREYYEKNRSRFGDRTLSDVTPEIEKLLSSEKEKEFLKDYARRLREEAVVSVNYDLLRWPEPSETEIEMLFTEKTRDLIRPGRAKVLLVSISTSLDKVEDSAKEARSKLLGGASEREMAQALGKGAGTRIAVRWIEDDSPLGQSLQLSRRVPGEVTDITNHEGARSVARVLKREERRQMTLDEAKPRLLKEARKRARERFLQQNAGTTLFTIHGKPYSLGDFREEFEELSPSEQARYSTFEERRKLLDRMIDRAVLVEKAAEGVRTKKSRGRYDRIRTAVLKQILHQEDVDDQLSVSEEELRTFFQRRHRSYRQPARVKVSYIRTAAGSSAPEDIDRARSRAEAALTALKASGCNDARFAEIAGKYSDDPAVSKTGGKIKNWISETDDLVTELFSHRFHENILKLKQGEFSQVFQVGNDFYVVWVRKREEARDRTFQEVRDLVTRDVKTLRHQQMTYKMEMELLQKAGAKIYDYTILNMTR